MTTENNFTPEPGSADHEAYFSASHKDHAAAVQRVAARYAQANAEGEAQAPDVVGHIPGLGTIYKGTPRMQGRLGAAGPVPSAADDGSPNPQFFDNSPEAVRRRAAPGTHPADLIDTFERGDEPVANELVKPMSTIEAPATLPPGYEWDADAVTGFAQIAQAEKMSHEGAQELMAVYGELSTKEPSGGWTMDESHAALDKLWGARKLDHVMRVQQYVASKPGLGAWLDQSGVGNQPAALAILHVLARVADGSIGQYRAELDTAYMTKDDPRHREAVQTVRVLHALGLA